ncbi:hypothetical protein M0812_17477 [Anaeramoeba flamelloides]|uniref:BTB domain-containing protein n=1 Tax=Anaeramoeba flamelloides TaxID=1746091 RepID=A0AAV7ZE87_9EUKA|nr:hypothetical protein M0812_17477 [Anaeramoeba flamelloides]
MEASFESIISPLLKSEQFSDFCFLVGNKKQKYKANKLLFSLTSNYWERALQLEQFQDNFLKKRGSCVEIASISVETFNLIHTFCYTRDLRGLLSFDNVLDLFVVSENFEMHSLSELCLNFIKSGLSVENCFDTFSLFYGIKIDKLQSLIQSWVVDNFQLIFSKPHICDNVNEKVLEIIFQCTSKVQKPILLFRRLIERGNWYLSHQQNNNSNNLNTNTNFTNYINNLLKYVKLDLLSQEEKEEVQKSGIFNVQNNNSSIQQNNQLNNNYEIRNITIQNQQNQIQNQSQNQPLNKVVSNVGITNVGIGDNQTRNQRELKKRASPKEGFDKEEIKLSIRGDFEFDNHFAEKRRKKNDKLFKKEEIRISIKGEQPKLNLPNQSQDPQLFNSNQIQLSLKPQTHIQQQNFNQNQDH